MNNNVQFIFPISDGTIGSLYMPPDLSVKDARRLKRMINAMYINGRQA